MTPHQPPPLTAAELEWVESRPIDTAMIDQIAYEYWMISNSYLERIEVDRAKHAAVLWHGG